MLASLGENVIAQLLFGALLMVISGGLVWHHVSAWDAARTMPENLRAVQFARKQYRRRMQASILVGIIGMAIAAGAWIQSTLVAAFFWSGVLLAVLWVVLLGVADAVNSLVFLRQQRKRHLVEQAELQAELLREIRRRREKNDDEFQ